MMQMDEQGYEMIGIYHSHILGFEGPSEIDLEESYYPDVAYLIWSPLKDAWQCHAYLLTGGKSTEIPIVINAE
jgi:proteasome lid subunit RPN8/RPN11